MINVGLNNVLLQVAKAKLRNLLLFKKRRLIQELSSLEIEESNGERKYSEEGDTEAEECSC